MSKEQDKAFLLVMALRDVENQELKTIERTLEEKNGAPFLRCPICGGRRQNPTLRRVCVYCGHVEVLRNE